MTVECSERDRLSALYEEFTSEYLRTIHVLNERLAVMPKEQYAAMRRAAEQARIQSEQTRVDLEKHCAEHGCSDGRLSSAMRGGL